MTARPDDRTVAAWTALMRAGTRTLGRIEASLKAAGLPPLEWYDALLEIERAGPQGIRPFALKERLLLPQYGTSRLLARLETQGLVARRACQEDRRGQVVAITAPGRMLRREMWPVYAEALEAALGTRLEPGEADTLARLLGRLG